jgi:DNA repair protein RadC
LHLLRQPGRRFRRGRALTSPADSQKFLRVRLAHLELEVFAVLWLDNRHRIIAFGELFRGTIDTPFARGT